MERKHLQPSKIGEFIANAIKLQNFDNISYERDLYTIEFNGKVEDISQDYSRYYSIVVSELSGLVTLYPFFK